MARPGASAAPPLVGRRWFQAGALVLATAVTLAALMGVTAFVGRPDAARPTATPSPYLLAAPRPAPDLRLTDAGGRPFDLASLRGSAVFVFFGYTHCPDVCPATVGVVGQVLDRVGSGTRAVFVSVDPERDTNASLAEYQKYLVPGFVAVSGSPAQVRVTADDWGVRYARVDGDDPGEYTMSHTATVFLVDPAGQLRAAFPFGTEPPPMIDVVRTILAATPPVTPSAGPPSPSPTPVSPATPAPATPTAGTPTATATVGDLRVEIVSSSVWSRGSPVILALFDGSVRLADLDARVEVRVVDLAGTTIDASVRAVAVQPPGVRDVSYVAELDVPAPGAWRLQVTVRRDGTTLAGTANLSALDPGGTAALGAAAPSVRTPTLDDVGGDATAVTTDPAPDLRLYRSSTVDVLAAGEPFVLVIDSWSFKTSPACGQAIVLGRFMLDRWPSVPIIHVEPFAYDVVSDTPVLRGSLSSPVLVPAAADWGIGTAPWGLTSMPWVFVVDGSGTVRAKYQGIIGSADIDVMLALLTR